MLLVWVAVRRFLAAVGTVFSVVGWICGRFDLVVIVVKFVGGLVGRFSGVVLFGFLWWVDGLCKLLGLGFALGGLVVLGFRWYFEFGF